MPMEQMTTLSEILNKLRSEGYTEDFNLNTDSLHYNEVQLHPADFVVDRHFRFEGASDPEDEAVAYAISSVDGKIKGVLVNSYGANSDTLADEMVKALRERKDL